MRRLRGIKLLLLLLSLLPEYRISRLVGTRIKSWTLGVDTKY